MGRIVKCRTCGETVPFSDRLELMEVKEIYSETTKKTKREYYHKGQCWDKFQEQEQFIKKEMQEKDELNMTIKNLHNIKYQIPSRIWEMIQDLRNGTNRYEKFWKRKYKGGVPYPVIREAYLMSKDDIEWAKLNRRFPTVEQEMSYCLRIIQKKLNDAHKKIERSRQSESFAKAKEKNVIRDISEDREVKYEKKKSKFDISHILGDD